MNQAKRSTMLRVGLSVGLILTTGVIHAAGNEETLPSVGARGVQPSQIPLDCLIAPYTIVELGSPVPGTVQSVHADRGDRVEESQVLVELESGVERATVALARARASVEHEIEAAEARFQYGRRRVERQDRLYEKRAVSFDAVDEAGLGAEVAELELERARTENRLARLELTRARAQLARRRIASPIDGVVIDRLTEPGERVGDEPVLRIAQLDPLRVQVVAQASLFGSVTEGMRAEITAEAPGGGPYEGEVRVVDPLVDAASGRFSIEVELANPDHEIPAGLKCNARFPSLEVAESSATDLDDEPAQLSKSSQKQ